MGLDEFTRKARLLDEEAVGRSVSATWAGIVVVGRDDAEVARLLDARSHRQLESDVWAGTTASLLAWLRDLRGAGASWAVLVPGGPPDRVELIATKVLPELRGDP
jgi:alkanesulfonate monooxygenase SsuD/methylene tetrahydromethanopterin reductase-like flavin-dependent oxidoreductase (luciferase family)